MRLPFFNKNAFKHIVPFSRSSIVLLLNNTSFTKKCFFFHEKVPFFSMGCSFSLKGSFFTKISSFLYKVPYFKSYVFHHNMPFLTEKCPFFRKLHFFTRKLRFLVYALLIPLEGGNII